MELVSYFVGLFVRCYSVDLTLNGSKDLLCSYYRAGQTDVIKFWRGKSACRITTWKTQKERRR